MLLLFLYNGMRNETSLVASSGTRWARDPVTGKSIKVPADMTYQQWYEKYVQSNPTAVLNEKKQKRSSADAEQYRRYKKILGENAPPTLDKFIEIKYNNSEQWDRLKTLLTSKNYLQKQLAYVLDTGEKNFIPTFTKFNSTPKVIAGLGSNTPIRVAEKLVKEYGGEADKWKKKVANIKSDKFVFDVHWYEYNGLQYEMKLKHRKERK